MTIEDTTSKAIEDLRAWERDAGAALPRAAEDIAEAEQFGLLIDLETGGVADIEPLPDHSEPLAIHLIDHSAWLAGLEAACGGNVTIAWAIRPEEYFAKMEAEKRA